MKRLTLTLAACLFALVLSPSAFAKKSCQPKTCKVEGSKECLSKAQAGYFKKLGVCKRFRARCYSTYRRTCTRKCGGKTGRAFRCHSRCRSRGFRSCHRRSRRCNILNAKHYKTTRRACLGTKVCCEKGYELVCSVCKPPRHLRPKRKNKGKRKGNRRVARKGAEG